MPFLPPVRQLGLVVDEMDRAMSDLGASFGVRHWYRSKMAAYEVVYRGQPTEIEWDIVVGYSGGIQIELIRVNEAGPNLYHDVLGDGTGLHHVGSVVRDLDRRLDRICDAGIDVLQSGSIRFAGGGACRFAYLDTADRLGVILELIEMKVYGLQVGMPEWLLRVGTLTGDVERLR
ncbi:MAG: VOC family protein [Candidatus Sulfomarinibacteraceae bacterium]